MADTPFTPVKSSMLTGYRYDPASRKLTVQYKGGATYEHDDVPMERVTALAENQSPGAYFNSRIKGLYPARKL